MKILFQNGSSIQWSKSKSVRGKRSEHIHRLGHCGCCGDVIFNTTVHEVNGWGLCETCQQIS